MANFRADLDTSNSDYPLTPYCDCVRSPVHVLPFTTWAEINVLYEPFAYGRKFSLSHEFVSPASSTAGVSDTQYTHTNWSLLDPLGSLLEAGTGTFQTGRKQGDGWT